LYLKGSSLSADAPYSRRISRTRYRSQKSVSDNSLSGSKPLTTFLIRCWGYCAPYEKTLAFRQFLAASGPLSHTFTIVDLMPNEMTPVRDMYISLSQKAIFPLRLDTDHSEIVFLWKWILTTVAIYKLGIPAHMRVPTTNDHKMIRPSAYSCIIAGLGINSWLKRETFKVKCQRFIHTSQYKIRW
jgi:hypothetical protein